MTRSFKTGLDAPAVSVNGTAVSLSDHTHGSTQSASMDTSSSLLVLAAADTTRVKIAWGSGGAPDIISLGGIAAVGTTTPTDGQVLTVVVGASDEVTVQNEDTTVSAAYRISTGDAAFVSLVGSETIQLIYNGEVNRWRFYEAALPAASTTVAGITALSTATNSTSTATAATPSAVKSAYDLAAAAVPSTRTLTGTAPITVGGVSGSGVALSANRTIAVSAASTSAAGVVQLSDSVTVQSSTLAATSTAVRTAYQLASSALPKTDSWKPSVRAATTANITLFGTQTIDGVSVSTMNRVLVKNQNNAAENGIYIVDIGGWTTADDASSAADLAGAVVSVESGTTLGGTVWTTTFKSTDTFGTTAMNWYRNIDSSAAATTTAAGIVQLSDSTSTTGSTKAATETAVKAAYDIGAAAIPKSTVTTAGDLIVATGSGAVTRLAASATSGQVLTSNGTGVAPTYQAVPAAAAGTLTGTTLASGVTASSLTSFGSSPTIATPALTLSTTTSTAEGRIAWDATNDQIEVGTGSALAEFGPLGSTNGTVLGVAGPGTSTQSARADHVHPTTGVVTTSTPTIVATFSRSGTIATGTGAARWYNHSGSTLTIKTVGAAVGTAPTGASLICDVNVGGTTIFSTQANRPTITASTNVATTTGFSTTTIANGGYLTVDVDQVGSTVAGAELVVTIWLAFA